MKLKEITISKELLVNLGNYSNIKIHVSVTDTDGDFESSWKKLNSELRLQESIEETRIKKGAPVKYNNKFPF